MLDKLEGKVLQMEQNFMQVRGQLENEQQNLGRLEVSHLRNNDEFKGIIGNLQQDFGSKLEIRMTELVNRILMEQEDRVRQLEEMKY